jgi:hypothetical protein
MCLLLVVDRATGNICTADGVEGWTSVLFCSVQFISGQFSSAQFSSVQFSSVQFSSVQFSSVQFSSVQLWSVQFGSVQFSSVQFCSVQFGSVQFSSVQLCSVLFSYHFIFTLSARLMHVLKNSSSDTQRDVMWRVVTCLVWWDLRAFDMTRHPEHTRSRRIRQVTKNITCQTGHDTPPTSHYASQNTTRHPEHDTPPRTIPGISNINTNCNLSRCCAHNWVTIR